MRIHLPRRALGVLALTATVSVGSGLIGASPAAAQNPPDRCGSPSNNTEWVPDRGPFWDFNEACHAHDICYEDKPHGTGPEGRLACDLAFREDARNSCASRGNAWARYECRIIAIDYYNVVRWRAADAFEAATPPTGTVTVGPIEQVPATPTVTVGEPETIPSGGGGGGGGYGGGGFIGGGFIGGGGGGGTPTVTVGPIEQVETEAE